MSESLHIEILGDKPASESHSIEKLLPALGIPADEASFGIAVINDLGLDFRSSLASWADPLRPETNIDFIVHKMSRPLATGELWNRLTAGADLNRITIVTADDLRSIEGINISSSLSWERTAKDFSHAIRVLEAFSQCPLLIVLFGTDGAILYRNEFGFKPEATLVFDPCRLENGFISAFDTDDELVTATFTASLAGHVAAYGFDALNKAIAGGLEAARRQITGKQDDHIYSSCEIEAAAYGDDPDPGFWRIVDQQTRNTRLAIAEEIVCHGLSEGLNAIPKGVFGALQTIDRAEIENFSAIRELLSEYVDYTNPPRPLCIAVFGPPGSGKSFGVKQVMKTLKVEDVVSKTFNISQFAGYADLARALHEVKDIADSGRLPFVFFDEFDSALDGKSLAWLASFLAPMQDGEFKDDDGIHPIGKAIFVFAGGTASTLDEFSRFGDTDFIEVKGPDFVSRLRGFVNVMGPNRQHESDDAYILRRALVLRVIFKLNGKTRQLFDEEDNLRIDHGILRAMLHIGNYKHGMRSIEALLDMSRIGRENRFNLAALPSKTQLNLHVDAEEFLWLTVCERYQNQIPPHDWRVSKVENRLLAEAAFVDDVAKQIHRNVIKNRKLEGKNIRLASDWHSLSEQEKQSFRDSAIDIPGKLRAVDHGMRKLRYGGSANIPDITDDELDKLARMEHNRRCQFLRLNGYSYAEKTDNATRKSSRLLPFDDMPSDRVNHYIQGIYAIPMVLGAIGYEIYRMEEHSEFHDKTLLEELARLVHEAYVKRELAGGSTTADNPLLVPFDELPQDKKDSNLDHAASIPKKLVRIGYRMRKLRPGEAAEQSALEPGQVETLAQIEHSRWVWQSLMQGWTYKEGKKDPAKKTNPDILPWAQLGGDIKQIDIDLVKLIPDLLDRAGYSILKV